MINVIGNRESEKALQLGKMYKPEEALAVNLVDEIVEPAELMQVAEQRMQEWCRIPSNLEKKHT
jgi:3,2-trans-enoyl-CoA isomerase